MQSEHITGRVTLNIVRIYFGQLYCQPFHEEQWVLTLPYNGHIVTIRWSVITVYHPGIGETGSPAMYVFRHTGPNKLSGEIMAGDSAELHEVGK